MISDRFFATEEVELEFPTPIEQAMQNLGAHVKAPGNQGKEESMVGSVTEGSTYLYRTVPGSRNSFRPTFYGGFSNDGGGTKLKGEITLNRVIKKFIVLWCAVVALVGLFTLLTLLRNPAASWWSLIYILIMLALCIFFFRTMIKKSSADHNWLKDQITRAISQS